MVRLLYLWKSCNDYFVVANKVIAIALLMGTPFFIFFGWLSDKIGRKSIMLTGMLVAAVSYIPIYMAMEKYSGWDPANPLATAVNPNEFMLTMLVFIQVLFVTMVYGPIAAFLVELFPTNIRYTSMSLPYHIGNGVFGGLVPFIGTSLVAYTRNHFSGLLYPIAIALITFVIGLIYIKPEHTDNWHRSGVDDKPIQKRAS